MIWHRCGTVEAAEIMKRHPVLDFLSLFLLIGSVGWLAYGPDKWAEQWPEVNGAMAAAGAVAALWLVLSRAQPEDEGEGRRMSMEDSGALEKGFKGLSVRLTEENRNLGEEVRRLKKQHESSEHYVDMLMENVPSNIYFKDRDSRFVRVNRSQAKWGGMGNPTDMVGKSDHDFFDPIHADQALADEKKILETGKPIVGYVERDTFPNGEEAYMLTTKMPFRDRSGKIIGTFGISNNVSELVETQQTLERERNVLRALVDSIPDQIFIKDANGEFTLVNKAFTELVERDHPDEVLGHTDADFFTREFADEMVDEERRILESGEPMFNMERARQTRNGEERTVVTTKVPLPDENGEPYAIVGMTRDVTEQRLAREALLRSERQIQDIVDNCPAVIYMKSVDGSYLLVNQQFEWLVQLKRKDVLGKGDYEVFDRESADAFRENDELVVEEGQPIQVEEIVPHEDGPHTYVSLKFPLRDLVGEIYAIGGVSTDITERKSHEEALAKLNADLMSANEDLRSAQEQLIQAEKMESVGRLAAGVAHEVKNPLAMIGLGLEIVARRAKGDEKMYDAVERMRRGVERAKDIIKGLVDFSSAHQLKLEECDLNAVVNEALALAKYQLKKGNVEVVTELCEELPRVEIDATKVEQVLLNLCVNALHAMDDGGTLTVRTRTGILKGVQRDEGVRTKGHLREGDCYVAVDILDEGAGISEEKLAKIFDPFFTTKATGVGSGLGLSVARKIIDLHHGMIEIENRMEGGIRAIITFKAMG